MNSATPMVDLERTKAHIPAFVSSVDGQTAVHGAHVAGQFNRRLAIRIMKSVGSMWCAYVFAAVALISLPDVLATGSSRVIIDWLAQTFLQLVLLPIIIVGQNVQSTVSDARAEADHATLNALYRLAVEVHSLGEQQAVILKRIEAREHGEQE